MKIIIGAMISIPPPMPGIVWDWMHLAVGLRRLGHDVYYVEQVAPDWCTDSDGSGDGNGGARCDYRDSRNRQLFLEFMRRFDLSEKCCQIYNGGEAVTGLSIGALTKVAKEADLLINQTGHVTSDIVLGNVRRRAYIDQDPVFTQIWRSEYGHELNFKSHDVFLTVGLNIGTPHSHIPDGGVKWRHTLPCVVVDFWPFEIDDSCERFTTVATWYEYGDISFGGEWYGTKSDELKRFSDLPAAAGAKVELMLKDFPDTDEAGIQRMRDGGWIIEPAAKVGDLDKYQRYIRNSRGEIGIAKNAYVKGNSGWFSDRAAQYLAAGKPVLAQSTGFERCLPTGCGLLSFKNLEEAVDGIRRINSDYKAHCRAARAFALEHLDYAKVLPPMLEACTR
jgi:hypothetical protein